MCSIRNGVPSSWSPHFPDYGKLTFTLEEDFHTSPRFRPPVHVFSASYYLAHHVLRGVPSV